MISCIKGNTLFKSRYLQRVQPLALLEPLAFTSPRVSSTALHHPSPSLGLFFIFISRDASLNA